MRQHVNLRDGWKFHTDPSGRGEHLGYAAPDFADDEWPACRLPCPAAQLGEAMDGYRGPLWFRARPAIGDLAGRGLVLRLEGIEGRGRAFFNGQCLGTVRHGLLPAEFPIDDGMLRDGANCLALEVVATPRPEDIPGDVIGWRCCPGVLREVHLEVRPPLHLRRFAPSPGWQAGNASFAADVEARNDLPDGAAACVQVRVLDLLGRKLAEFRTSSVDLAPGQAHGWRVEGAVPGARPWSPDAPVLHDVEATLFRGGEAVDRLVRRTGFRSIGVDGGRLGLNGREVFLTGFNRHEDSPRTDRAADLATARQDLVRMKQAGANFVRLCHYPHHPGELDLCDEIGLLVMEEIPLYWLAADDPRRQDLHARAEAAREQLEAMIRRDRHHPSTIFWSVGNEGREDQPPVVETNTDLVRRAKQIDPTRLAVHVSNHWRKHPHFEADDVICVNGYPHITSWDAPDLPEPSEATWRDDLARLHALAPDRPILVTEFGYPSLAGQRGGALGEDTAARVLAAELAGMDAPYVCGATVWVWADHAWPPGAHLGGLAESPFGAVTRSRRAKQALAALTDLFRRRQGLPAAPGDPLAFLQGLSQKEAALTMVRPDMGGIPDFAFPEGFSMRGLAPGDAALWTDIWREAERLTPIGDDLFHEQFGSDWARIAERVFFIQDARGFAVGTLAAWGDEFRGADYGRLHWVAIRPGYRGGGLIKPAMTFTMRAMARWHCRAYLCTQAMRLPALKVYLDFGFLPDPASDRERALWALVAQALPHPVLTALNP